MFKRPAWRKRVAFATWCMVGAIVGAGLAVMAGLLMDNRIESVLVTQLTARAMDHVRLGVLTRVTPQDFAEPHSPIKLADIRDRLDPVLQHLSSDESGVLGVDLISGDGVVVYSDQSGRAGRLATRRERVALDEALSGRVVRILDSNRDPGEDALDGTEDQTIDVLVPVSMGGVIVGAYEMDLATGGLRWGQPFVLIALAILGASAGALAFVLRIARSSTRRKGAPHAPVEAAPVIHGTGTTSLSPRELEVLGLLADGHSYRAIARELVLSEETVRSHVKRILRKTGQANRTAAVTAALREGAMQLHSPPRVNVSGTISSTKSPSRVSANRKRAT